MKTRTAKCSGIQNNIYAHTSHISKKKKTPPVHYKLTIKATSGQRTQVSDGVTYTLASAPEQQQHQESRACVQMYKPQIKGQKDHAA